MFRSRAVLELENLALRHQIGVLQRSARKRFKLTPADRLLWVWLSRIWSGLAFGPGHRQARNGRGLASCWLSPVLDLEGAARPNRTAGDCPRGSRPDPPDVPEESRLGCTPHPRRAAQTLDRTLREQRQQIHGARPQAAVTDLGRTFLNNHLTQLVSIDFFTVPTLRFQVLYVFLVPAHDRRRILHCNVTALPTAEWTGQQLREAFPFDQPPRYLLRDRDAIFGTDFRNQVRDMGIEEVLSAPRSPWQRAYIERVIGSIRRECLDHVIVFHEASLRRTVASYLDYYHRSRTHLSLGKDSPEPRGIQPPEMGSVVALPQVGGLHHRYERRVA
jgi:transposase InsO family protein